MSPKVRNLLRYGLLILLMVLVTYAICRALFLFQVDYDHYGAGFEYWKIKFAPFWRKWLIAVLVVINSSVLLRIPLNRSSAKLSRKLFLAIAAVPGCTVLALILLLSIVFSNQSRGYIHVGTVKTEQGISYQLAQLHMTLDCSGTCGDTYEFHLYRCGSDGRICEEVIPQTYYDCPSSSDWECPDNRVLFRLNKLTPQGEPDPPLPTFSLRAGAEPNQVTAYWDDHPIFTYTDPHTEP